MGVFFGTRIKWVKLTQFFLNVGMKCPNVCFVSYSHVIFTRTSVVLACERYEEVLPEKSKADPLARFIRRVGIWCPNNKVLQLPLNLSKFLTNQIIMQPPIHFLQPSSRLLWVIGSVDRTQIFCSFSLLNLALLYRF